jgi:membrane protein DedA with SNARE-associated domain
LVVGTWPFAIVMDETTRKKWLPLAVLAGALLVWAGLFALGAYLELGADQPHRDYRKPLIIMGAMLAFLSFWGIALWLRKRRIRRDL